MTMEVPDFYFGLKDAIIFDKEQQEKLWRVLARIISFEPARGLHDDNVKKWTLQELEKIINYPRFKWKYRNEWLPHPYGATSYLQGYIEVKGDQRSFCCRIGINEEIAKLEILDRLVDEAHKND